MAYTRHTWQSGEVISSALLNNIEDGIEEAASSGGVSLKFVKDSEGSYEKDEETITYTGGVAEGMVGDDIPEEYRNKATGSFSHAEGGGFYQEDNEYYPNIASGEASHAEGSRTTASGDASHAEGAETTASGGASHAEGWNTIANHKSQHVFGECNIEDPSTDTILNRGTYVEIVGNGTNTNRSNARTLDWSGNEVLSGTLTATGITIGSTSVTEAQLQSLLALLNT